MEEFKRENRYVVLKRKDVRGTLTPEEQGQLNSVCDRIEEQRRLLAKPKLRCVVVESDWKIYNEVWALVQQESEGTLPQQSLYERLANQVADLKREKGGLQLELEAERKDGEKNAKRVKWMLPLLGGDDSPEADKRTLLLANELMRGKSGLEAIDAALEATTPEKQPATSIGVTATRLCKDHPEAPHGFNRNASHSAGRYVCECEGWIEPVTKVR